MDRRSDRNGVRTVHSEAGQLLCNTCGVRVRSGKCIEPPASEPGTVGMGGASTFETPTTLECDRYLNGLPVSIGL